MRDKSDRYQVETVPTLAAPKRLGGYLVEAGLLTGDQVTVALNDQEATGMRFGDVVVARGWLKEQTVEWVMEKVVVPERKAQKRGEQRTLAQSRNQSTLNQRHQDTVQQRRTVPPEMQRSQIPTGRRPPQPPPRPPQPPARPPQPSRQPQTNPMASSVNPNQSNSSPASDGDNSRPLDRRPPISKPLPPVNSSDNDVNWVG